MNIKFSLIIPTFNSHKDLKKLLASLIPIKSELDEVEILVIDDGSDDDTEMVVRDFKDQFEIIEYYYQKNKGPAAARNWGAQKANGEYLIFVDDDCLMPEGCLKAIKDFYKENPNYAGVGVKTTNSSRSLFSEFNQRLGDYLIDASLISDHRYGYVSSRCYSFNKASFWSINGHDEGFIWPAAEDRDFCLKLKKNNLFMGYIQSIAVINADHLRFRAFIRQNFLYGLGFGLLKQKHPDIPSAGLSRYRDMIYQICKDPDLFKVFALFYAFCLAQICFLAGLIMYKINFDYNNRPPSVFLPRHVIIVEIIKNFLLGVPLIKSMKNRSGSLTTGEELRTSGYLASLAQKTTDTYKEAIFKVFQDSHWLNGKKVLEIGPGSHLGISVSFMAAGAAKVVSIDKYGEVKFRQKEQEVYERILSNLPEPARERALPYIQGLNLKKVSDLDSFAINYLLDVCIDSSDCQKRLPHGYFDLIVSYNTLEHIKDLSIAFRNMKVLLKKGGIFIHKVDAASHYAIARYTKNSLAQLIPSEKEFNLMFSNRDAPTRRFLDDYKKVAENENIPIILHYAVETATNHEMNSTLRFLGPAYRKYSEEQLSQLGFMIVAQKQ